ncbi:hypothetical protein CBM2634_B70089 [Cupriavidus taiwanensis]|uniref:Uncharacterized protein n=1 Tax=Cupriavidus taiwanensis TaxID=164546 RepID=A0A375JAU3_9BURK|nr:hypothetical protein CBM2634_B70089 [Cupriavidus taiwanensis]
MPAGRACTACGGPHWRFASSTGMLFQESMTSCIAPVPIPAQAAAKVAAKVAAHRAATRVSLRATVGAAYANRAGLGGMAAPHRRSRRQGPVCGD